MTTPAEADKALEEAIALCASAYGWDGIHVGYILMTESQMFDDDGISSTVVGYTAPDGQSWIRTLGILRAGTLRLERDYITQD